MMKSKLVRENAPQKGITPAALEDVLRVPRTGMTLLLAGAALLLAGLIVFGVFGRLDTTLRVGAQAQDGRMICYIREEDAGMAAEGMTVRADGRTYAIAAIAGEPVRVDGQLAEYLRHVGGLMEGEWVYEAALEGEALPEGRICAAEIVVEKTPPLAFVLN